MTDRKPHPAARTRTATTKTVAAKKAAAKPAKKPTKPAPAKKTAAKKTAARKTSAKVTTKPATKKTTTTKKTAAKKSVNKKPAKQKPAQVARLSADERARLHALLAAADAGLILSDEMAAHAGGDEQRERYAEDTWTMGTIWSPALWAACRAAVARLEQLAETPPRRTSDFTGIEIASVLFVDTADPTTLLYAPNPEMPAALFVPIPADVASVRTVLAEYSAGRERSVKLRAWMGFGSQLLIPNVYSGELGAVDDHELDRFYCFSPVATTLSRRTYFSDSKFSYEQHGEDLFIWDLAYPPCTTSPPAIANFKRITGYDFPPDMPVDLAAAVEGFEFSSAAELEARISSEPENTAPILTVISAIGWRSLTTPANLRKYVDRDPGVQANLVNAAFRYGWERLIADILRAAGDPDLQTQIADALAGLAFPILPTTSDTRHVLPATAELSTFENLATTRGWTAQQIPDSDIHTRAIYTLPGHTDAAPRRITWIDVPALELQTLALEQTEDELPAISAALPDTDSSDPWRAAAVAAWLGHDAPLLAHLRAALTSEAWPDRQSAARLIGVTAFTPAIDLVVAALANESHPATDRTLTATLEILAPSAAPPDPSQRN